eukprot:CAMPEP_0178740706 /NCGR_PEP_ID=MMETSP0744-20121128/4735_1 /TAXON_ID=913974 /ORGANISM="Nitzschia punctata, Strain CCMP561" /LENGTH=257 /DNA_ID=CAMNT_0020393501 /DNA_START=260 /DNA_END=1030 /DNA_ORIENTATION=-
MAPFSNQEQPMFLDDECSLASTASSSSCSLVTPPAKRAVSFSDESITHEYIHISEYSLAERRDAFCSAEDMRRVRENWREVVAWMDQNSNTDGSICTRGLEGKTQSGKKARRAARTMSMYVVLDEQESQEMEGVRDPVMIARAYSDCNYPQQVEAYLRASQDYQEARAIHELPPVESDEDKEETTAGPTKFDFESVRSKYLYESSNDNVDATIATVRASGTRHDNVGIFLGSKLRNQFACLLPIAPKRYGRRVRKTW